MLPAAPATPDWMKSLLPDGGKVSVTVHSAPTASGGAATPSVDPTTGVALAPGTAPAGASQAVAALRSVGAPADPSRTPVNTTPGTGVDPTHTIPTDTPRPPAPTTLPPGKGPGGTTPPTPNSWWNPYTGRYDTIPGVDANGKVIDANAFWNYYTKYPSSGLDAIANGLATGNDPSTWQHQYTDAEKQAMVTGSSDYITGLGGINQNRFNELMTFGNLTDAQAAAFGLTPEQVKAIRENPNSNLNAVRDALRTGTYEHAAGYAARGAYNSGARMNDIGNLQTTAVKQQLGLQTNLNAALESENQRVQALFRDTKDAMAKEGGFDPGDTEHNKAAWEATHKTIGAAQKTVTDFMAHVANWQKLTTVTDMRSALNDARKAYAQYGKLISPADAGKLKAIIDGLTAKIHTTVMGRVKPRPPVKGGAQAGGPSGYVRP